MGANQSSNADDDSSGRHRDTNGEAKRCYYEILGVERQASEEEWVYENVKVFER